jgi:hypothetical protein
MDTPRVTAEELAEVNRLVTRLMNTPVITIGVGHPDFASMARDDLNRYLEQLGQTYGVPGYGINLRTGELHPPTS